ncbi:hypothetical protein KORDIASMS9_02879 [Kordia sp. SMS9]|uniref:hypothetical protein n=1 Tax=Kordia sp. SMS9 TaxID=2282170 RepID=UPI000E0D4993|nr:hypothetical protein [Kordia sp. SMS9]AXG70638.1 hypothetical protein KORDIASMS9_02879 [Kordia sp. SMS9]
MLQKISKLKGAHTLSKKDQKIVNGGRLKPLLCGGTGHEPISWSQDRCFGYGIVWYNGQCYACH